MQRSKALVILTKQIIHRCPYKGQDTFLATCYVNAQDGHHEFCYGCDYVATMKQKWGLRTFNRKIVLSRCRHCYEAASLHDANAPHKCTRIPSCPGFEPEVESTKVYVPTNLECTEWMVVDTATGERVPYVEHRKTWDAENWRRYQIALLGAPGTVQADSRDDLRVQLAHEAAKRRGRPEPKESDEESVEQTQTKPRRKKAK